MRILSLFAACAALVLISACTVHVKKDEQGHDKNVDINTPFGGIHVDKSADAQDTGLPLYPGARLKQKSAGDNSDANVNISGMGYGIRVAAAEYESDSSPRVILDYYREQLKKYGNVLECHTTGPQFSMHPHPKDEGASQALSCESQEGSNIELKAGTQRNQHIVSVKPEGKGSDFALVHVETHGKDSI